MEQAKTSLILGIDDAGRGPIIGPMVMAGVLIDESKEKTLKDLEVKDSKMLTRFRRDKLEEEIKKHSISHKVITIFPDEVDGRNHVGLNLNKIEALKAAEIINELTEKINEEIKIVIDCPSPNISAWKGYLLTHIKKRDNLKVVCAHKADRDFVACSAASIIAKVTRDREVDKIKKQIGINFGSGYPSDPLTKEFLKNYSSQFEHDGIFRKTWQTWKNNHARKEQKTLYSYKL